MLVCNHILFNTSTHTCMYIVYTCTYTQSYFSTHTHTHIHTQIAGVNYGGHVTDDFDRKVLKTYIEEMFRNDVIEQPYYKYVHTLYVRSIYVQ